MMSEQDHTEAQPALLVVAPSYTFVERFVHELTTRWVIPPAARWKPPGLSSPMAMCRGCD
jgi:hypothetical protein